MFADTRDDIIKIDHRSNQYFRFTCMLIFTCFFLPGLSQDSELKIALFYDSPVQTIIFSPEKGDYFLNKGLNTETIISRNEVIYISLMGDSLAVRGLNSFYGYFKKIKFLPDSSGNIFSLRPVHPKDDKRSYRGALSMAAEFMRVMAINHVNIDDYLSGVVLSEAGGGATLEFYKAQAILCRTYTMANLERHGGEGFNLCDGVHCQAYKQQNGISPLIDQAIKETGDEVVVHEDTFLITAAFHANCGGQTQNAEREWLSHEPYLREVVDPYCKNGRNRTWKKTIPLHDWKSYLLTNGFSSSNVSHPGNMICKIDRRKDYYQIGASKISYRKIRTDWFLKSSFFSVNIDRNNDIVLQGHGYGHGIGMCQEGGMNMGRLGFNYHQILNFYFRGINIVSYSAISKF